MNERVAQLRGQADRVHGLGHNPGTKSSTGHSSRPHAGITKTASSTVPSPECWDCGDWARKTVRTAWPRTSNTKAPPVGAACIGQPVAIQSRSNRCLK